MILSNNGFELFVEQGSEDLVMKYKDLELFRYDPSVQNVLISEDTIDLGQNYIIHNSGMILVYTSLDPLARDKVILELRDIEDLKTRWKIDHWKFEDIAGIFDKIM